MRRLCLALISPFLLLAKPLEVEVSAPVALVMNGESGAILYEKNGRVPTYPASITKVATALYVLEKKGKSLQEMVTATADCLEIVPSHVRTSHPPYRLEMNGTSMGLKIGETVSLETLLYGLILRSGNDAANVLAHYIEGSVEKFMEKLNEFLREKEIYNTYLLNPHGLHHPSHQTTAYDMALITKEALKNPLFREVVKTTRYQKPATNKQKSLELIHSNQLLKPGRFYYPKAIGIKTGHTFKAGYTLIAAAEHEGRLLITVLLGCSTFEQRYRDAIRLFEAAFNQKKVERKLFTKDHDHFWLELKKGKTSLEAALGEDFYISYFPSEEPLFKPHLKWDCVELPILPGQFVGRVELLTDEGVCIKSSPLFAMRGVEKTVWGTLTDLYLSYKIVLVASALSFVVCAALFYFLKKPKEIV